MAKLTIQQFPQDMSVFPVPHRNFDRCLISGLFQIMDTRVPAVMSTERSGIS